MEACLIEELIPLSLLKYEIFIANSDICALLAVYHLMHIQRSLVEYLLKSSQHLFNAQFYFFVARDDKGKRGIVA